jgi:hypothetical protein
VHCSLLQYLGWCLCAVSYLLLPLPMLCPQASSEYSSALHELGSAEAALSHMAAGFELEEATSRRSSAAPPSALLMAGRER